MPAVWSSSQWGDATKSSVHVCVADEGAPRVAPSPKRRSRSCKVLNQSRDSSKALASRCCAHNTAPTMMLVVALAATALAAPRLAGRPTSDDLETINYEYTFEAYAAVSAHPPHPSIHPSKADHSLFRLSHTKSTTACTSRGDTCMWLGGGCGGSWPEAKSLLRLFYTCLQHRVFLMGAPLPLHPTNKCTIIKYPPCSTTNHPIPVRGAHNAGSLLSCLSVGWG
jgi:hypothetical protein